MRSKALGRLGGITVLRNLEDFFLHLNLLGFLCLPEARVFGVPDAHANTRASSELWSVPFPQGSP